MQNLTYRCEWRKLSTECPTTLSGQSDTGRAPCRTVANYKSHAERDTHWDRLTKECGERCTVLSLVFDLGIWDLRKTSKLNACAQKLKFSSQSRLCSPCKCPRLFMQSRQCACPLWLALRTTSCWKWLASTLWKLIKQRNLSSLTHTQTTINSPEVFEFGNIAKPSSNKLRNI